MKKTVKNGTVCFQITHSLFNYSLTVTPNNKIIFEVSEYRFILT